MRKGLMGAAATLGIVAMTFWIETIFPLGDWRWGVTALVCAVVWWRLYAMPDDFFVRVRRRLSSPGDEDVRALQVSPQHAQPKVIPVKYGEANQHELGNKGLLLKNVGEPAVEVVVHPFKLGARTVMFSGREVSCLDTGDTCFLAVAVEIQPRSFSTDLFDPFRDWQREVGDMSCEATGRVTYKDVHGCTYETTYQIGVDVLNSDGGMVVRFVGSKKS